ncbi:MAG: hypothetical protein M1817_002678 [Caeruleum heppii]|nr:MAG: hypothetical protein M1817_002678 [Caeruleum heppii]
MGQGHGVILTTAVDMGNQLAMDMHRVYRFHPQFRDAGRRSLALSLDPENNITCTGPFPPWPGPEPFDIITWDTFGSLQDLCSVQLAGGTPEANAGGYCHRLGNGRKVVWFTDELTPRPDWTWNHFPFSTLLRMHCIRYCRCLNTDERRFEPSTDWALRPAVQVITNEVSGVEVNGSIDIKAKSSDGSQQDIIIPILPAVTAGVPVAAGTCGPDGRRLCSKPWPSEVLGPTPTAPPGASISVTPALPGIAIAALPEERVAAEFLALTNTSTRPARHHRPPKPEQLPTCGSTCQNNRECRANNAPSSCRCLAVGEPVARQFGLDPVFPTALCLIFSAGLANTLANYAKGLPKRSEVGNSSDDDGAGGRWGCACNGTYVSRACCDSEDGMVWEAVDLRLGRLAR